MLHAQLPQLQIVGQQGDRPWRHFSDCNVRASWIQVHQNMGTEAETGKLCVRRAGQTGCETGMIQGTLGAPCRSRTTSNMATGHLPCCYLLAPSPNNHKGARRTRVGNQTIPTPADPPLKTHMLGAIGRQATRHSCDKMTDSAVLDRLCFLPELINVVSEQ